jgi:L-alanine-DL-glutamate epimerase-like enolase superfamily enzyme
MAAPDPTETLPAAEQPFDTFAQPWPAREDLRTTRVRSAWHAPGDTSPVGAAANAALDVSSPAFGSQEGNECADAVHEVFPGTLVAERGWLVFP